MKTYVSCGIKVQGYHHYPKSKLIFLKHEHLHEFSIKAKFIQLEDRGIEFFDIQNTLCEIISNSYDRQYTMTEKEIFDFKNHSCESIAQGIINYLQNNLMDDGLVSITVAEDDLNYAEVFCE